MGPTKSRVVFPPEPRGPPQGALHFWGRKWPDPSSCLIAGRFLAERSHGRKPWSRLPTEEDRPEGGTDAARIEGNNLLILPSRRLPHALRVFPSVLTEAQALGRLVGKTFCLHGLPPSNAATKPAIGEGALGPQTTPPPYEFHAGSSKRSTLTVCLHSGHPKTPEVLSQRVLGSNSRASAQSARRT